MNYHNIETDNMLNGDGLRVVLWVAGCEHHCKGCQNPVTWDPKGGLYFGQDALNEIFEELKKDYISGITFSGGDPLHPDNRIDILSLSKVIKHEFPNKTIWLYTGYNWEEIKHLRGIDLIDVIVDGKFEEDRADVKYPWAGSTNQRIIDVKTSLECGCAMKHETHNPWLEREVRHENHCG